MSLEELSLPSDQKARENFNAWLVRLRESLVSSEREACAALVRAAGCLADDGESGSACWVHDFHEGSRRARTPEEHDPRCPQALAAAIEARRG